MPRRQHHPEALFSLIPANEQAEQATRDLRNDHLAWTYNVDAHGNEIRGNDIGDKAITTKLALDIGFHIRSRSARTLAILGRGEDADVFIGGSSISKIQCSFEINLDTKVVMLFDRSHAQTTQVDRSQDPRATTTQFEDGRRRQIVVMKHLNEIVRMGGSGRDLVKFEIEWHHDQPQTMQRINRRESLPLDYLQEVEETPQLAHTLSQDLDTLLPSRSQTTVHSPRPEGPTMRYLKLDRLGSGTFGTVSQALDLDTGRFMAVKILHQPPGGGDYVGKREVDILSRINHPHIVEFYHSQVSLGQKVEIFMGLKDGSLGSLLGSQTSHKPSSPESLEIAKLVYHQILQALDFLAFHGVAHRDVKPDNILYSLPPREGQYRFQLGDFGLCSPHENANSQVGSFPYMAPELYNHPEQQDPKVDIWSLLLTMLWVFNADNFRGISKQISIKQIQNGVLKVSSTSNFPAIRAMARIKPQERPSAAQLLLKYYHGEGLTTPRDRIEQFNDTAPATPGNPGKPSSA